MSIDISDSLLRSLSPAQVRLYALHTGWTLVNGVKRPVSVLNHPTEELTQIHIPTTIGGNEYAYLMGDAVRKLAEVEKRPASELLYDLNLPPADVVRLRLSSRDAESGTLPMELGLSLIQGGKDLLQAAACSVHHPQSYYRSAAFGSVTDFLRSCRIGQTERGSYVISIIAPVSPELSRSIFDPSSDEVRPDEEPFERRVTLTLMRALQTLRGSLDSGKTSDLVRAIPQGVSANLCDALGNMAPADSQSSLQISLGWSRSRPRVPKFVASRVDFAQPEFGWLREAGRRLKSIEPKAIRVEGPIIGLQAEPADLFAEFQGSVTIRTVVEGRPARVRFLLKQDEYTRACDAHRDRRQVEVIGTLHDDAKARIFDLLQPHSFRILQNETA